ncbi:MAG: SET domain-containing protein-lysine N-methyltransferase [Candidatus Staskawiczbacteria bacterium]|nr:SET domain-containing protein-lysine N-methyltransferase [Candidatus Staskawiczbacteria bacterium]
MEILPPKKIKIANIKGKGRGVVATKSIKKGEIIEYCPIIFLSKKEANLFKSKKTILHFYYLWQYVTNKYCLMLGYGSIYNHSLAPNADVDYNTKKLKNYLIFKAIKNIKAGEEIVYDYEFDDNKEDFLKLN